MTNLRIAAQRASAATRHIYERKIEHGFFFKFGCIGKPALHAIGMRGEAFAQIGKPPRTRFASDDLRVGVAFRKDERLAAGRSARIENFLLALV